MIGSVENLEGGNSLCHLDWSRLFCEGICRFIMRTGVTWYSHVAIRLVGRVRTVLDPFHLVGFQSHWLSPSFLLPNWEVVISVNTRHFSMVACGGELVQLLVNCILICLRNGNDTIVIETVDGSSRLMVGWFVIPSERWEGISEPFVMVKVYPVCLGLRRSVIFVMVVLYETWWSCGWPSLLPKSLKPHLSPPQWSRSRQYTSDPTARPSWLPRRL